MLRSILSALAAVAAVAALPAACQSGGVGAPCTPGDEYTASFSGYHVMEEYIESRSFQCTTRICLVNHFQGRVSCPLGQAPADIHPCAGPHDTSCAPGEACTASQPFAPACNTCDPANDPTCVPERCPLGLTCDTTRGVCTCDSTKSPTLTLSDVSYVCDYFDAACVPSSEAPCTGVLESYFCHRPGACQQAGATDAENQGNACCIPGMDAPVGVPVCGQCDRGSGRDAEDAVYCSCRCGVADGDPPEPDFNFCACPSGFACTSIRSDLTLDNVDKQLTGKYCVKQGTAYDDVTSSCGTVRGYSDTSCAGIGGG